MGASFLLRAAQCNEEMEAMVDSSLISNVPYDMHTRRFAVLVNRPNNAKDTCGVKTYLV